VQFTSPFFYFCSFFIFFNTQSGHLPVGPAFSLGGRQPTRCCASQRSRGSNGALEARRPPRPDEGERAGVPASCARDSYKLEEKIGSGRARDRLQNMMFRRQRSTKFQTRSKLETKMQKRSMNQDSYKLEEKIREKTISD
jgi:hypothetical protein